MAYLRNGSYVARWVDAAGVKRTRAVRFADVGGPDEARRMAQAIEADRRRRAYLEASGLLSPAEIQLLQAGQLALSDLIAEHLGELVAAGRTPDHVRVRGLVINMALGHLATPAQIHAHELGQWLHRQAAARGWSGRTFNAYRKHLGAFCRWLVSRQILAADPTAGLPSRDQLPVRLARSLDRTEARRLLSVSVGQCRPAVYQLLLFTGLRWAEAARLTGDQVQGDVLVVPPSASKTHREAVIPLGAMAAHAAGVLPIDRPDGRTWRGDLVRAGIDRRTTAGWALRKSLRKTFSTWLELAGVDPGVADLLLRHGRSIRERHYVDRRAVVARMRAGVEALEGWYRQETLPW